MAWDSSRPIPWNRLLKEAAIFLVLGAVIFAFFLKNSNVGSYVGLVIGMLLYVGFSVVLAKFGYSRESMKQARARQMAARRSRAVDGWRVHGDEPAEAAADQADQQRAVQPAEAQAPLSRGCALRHRHRRRHHRRAQPGDRARRPDGHRVQLPRVHPALPAAGVGGARRRRDLGRRRRHARATWSPRWVRSRSSPSGITNQRETIVAWDRHTGAPYGHAIVWQDRRTAARCDELTAAGELPPRPAGHRARARPVLLGHQDRVAAGQPRHPARRRPGARHHRQLVDLEAHRRRGARHRSVQRQPDDAVRHRRARVVDRAVCLFGVPMSALPEVRPSSGRFGLTAAARGVPAGIPIAGVAGDQQAALFGQACTEPGMAKNTYGTGSFVLLNVGPTARRRPRGCSPRWRGRSPTAPSPTRSRARSSSPAPPCSGCATSCRSSTTRRRSKRWPTASPTPAGSASSRRSPGSGSPWWDPYARGTIVGITRGTTRAHLARAVVESMAFQTRDVVEAMAARRRHGDRRPARRRRRIRDGLDAADAGRSARRHRAPPRRPRDDCARRGLPRRSGRGRVAVAGGSRRRVAARRACSRPTRTAPPPTRRTPPGCAPSNEVAAGRRAPPA